jgi:hypothetical protein
VAHKISLAPQDGTKKAGSNHASPTAIHRLHLHPYMAQRKRAVAPHGPLQSTGTAALHKGTGQQPCIYVYQSLPLAR